LTGAGRRKPRPARPAAGAPKALLPPDWIVGTSARAVWKRIVPELQRLNIMNESFRDPVGRYCLHFADWIRLSKEIARDGTTMMVKMTNSEERMPRVNPAIRVRDTLERSLIDIEDRFGLSPLARFRIVSHQAANPQRDLFGREPAPAPDADQPPMPPPSASPVGVLRSQLN
jgi:P27 family predicted phage terminase small subunit